MTKKPDLVLYVGSRDELFFVTDGKFEKPRERQRPPCGSRTSPPPVQPIVNTSGFMWPQAPSVQPQANTYCYMWPPVSAVQPRPTMPGYIYPQPSPQAVDESIRTSSAKPSSGSIWHPQPTNSFNRASGDSCFGCDMCNSAASDSWFEELLRVADEREGMSFC